MSISRTVLGLAATALMVANIGIANAAEENGTSKESAVLFKIHDVVPVKNNEGEVIGCDYMATFYNRTDMIVKNATLNLSWDDTAIGDVIDQEKKSDAEKNRRNFGRARSTTERNTDKSVFTQIDVPTIRPAKQVSVTSRVNTDRCFLLIDKVNFDVKNCTTESAKGAISGRGGRNGERSCSRLFTFVNPEDPQYYLEFKAVSVDQEKAEIEEARKNQESKNNDMYKKAVAAIDASSAVISGIK